DKAIHAEPLLPYSAGIHQTQAMLDAGSAIGNLSEIPLAELFLFLKAERTMIGRDHLQMIVLQPVPEFFLVPLFAQRRSEDVFGAFKAGSIHIFKREIEVLRTGLRIDRQSPVAGFANFLEGVVAAEMNDVHRSARHLGKSDSTPRGLGFGRSWTAERMIFWRGLPLG